MPMKSRIIKQLEKHSIGGCFLRHIDGQRQNNHLCNLALIHPYDAFTHLEWVVDWDSHLTPAQTKFVRNNIGFFVRRYNQVTFDCPLKGKAHISNPDNQSELVSVEEADKYKEFIAESWNSTCEERPEMKNAPNAYLWYNGIIMGNYVVASFRGADTPFMPHFE